MAKAPVRVAVTGAAGQIGYSLLFRIASGEMLGKDQPVILQLLEIPDEKAQAALKGVMMELDDCAFPLLAGMVPASDPKLAFKDIDVALLVGARPRSKGMERKDLLEANGAIFTGQGRALNEVAKRTVKVLVVGNPANTNAYIAMKSAPDLPRENFTAMLRLDHNRALSQLAAKTGKPVLLKRGLSMKMEEWLLAGEYILANENPNLMFCERGVRTFETYTRNLLDLGAIPILKKESHCPVVIDPSQGAGRADLVAAMCKGAVAMGADALLIEVHPNPAEAWSDGAQQLTIEGFAKLMEELKPIIAAAGRE